MDHARKSKSRESDDVARSSYAPIRVADHSAVRQLMTRDSGSVAGCRTDMNQHEPVAVRAVLPVPMTDTSFWDIAERGTVEPPQSGARRDEG